MVGRSVLVLRPNIQRVHFKSEDGTFCGSRIGARLHILAEISINTSGCVGVAQQDWFQHSEGMVPWTGEGLDDFSCTLCHLQS